MSGSPRRVVVTGVGAVSPCGIDTDSTWAAITSGQSGIARITHFDPTEYASQIAGEVKNFDPEVGMEKKKLKEADRFIHFAMAATKYAVEQSGLSPQTEEEKERVGTFIGVGMCGLQTIENVSKVLNEKGPRKVTPYFIPATIANLAPGQVSMKYGYKGPNYTTTSACSSGAHAIGEAMQWILRGHLDAAVAGGAEACITTLGVGGFCAMRALSQSNEHPTKASRPFDKDRDGFVIAEGAGIVVLEEYEHAKKRGANIIAELIGYGATSDAYHLTQPAPEGEGAQRAMKMAIADARISLDRVDYVNAHGTSTGVGDINEIKALKAVFGERAANHLWVSSTKSMTGHLLGAAGGLEAVFSVLSIRDSIVPPTINLDAIEPECVGVDLVPHEARQRKLDVVLSNSFGFGGTNVTLAFARPT